MMIFEHTHRERGMWRGWIKNGQVLELHWSRPSFEIGAGILVHSDESDFGHRMLCIKLGWLSAYIPLGVTKYEVDIDCEPQWSAFISREFGLILNWGERRKSYDLPGTVFTLAYEQQMADGSWRSVFRSDEKPYTKDYPYTYVLASGEIQKRSATVSKRRHVLARKWLHRVGWPKWIKESIDVQFDDEVGERTGSWKGGTIGCGYDLRSGEHMLSALRRMERDRRFT